MLSLPAVKDGVSRTRRMKQSQLFLPIILCSALLLSACGDDKTNGLATQPSNTPPTLPDNAPAVGTSINSLVKPPDSELAKLKTQYADYQELAWTDLELPGQGLADIMKKYQPQLDAIPEGGSTEDEKLMEKMQAEMNAAPVNPALNGKKIKLPGYISPLEVDDQKGTVKEFLLVPYFGACIHVPPPPLNQTLLVKPLADKSLGMERMYEPVWVYGTLSTTSVKTELAEAGYQILDAKVELYEVDQASTAADTQPAAQTPSPTTKP